MPTTPVYALPYQGLFDPPDGPSLGEDLALAVEAELVRIDGELDTVEDAHGHTEGITNACGTSTTTSATYVNLPATSSFSFTKQRGAETKLKVFMSCSSFAQTNPAGARFAVLVNGVDTDICQHVHSAINTRNGASGMGQITGLAAGTYTVQGRWKRVSGTGTMAVNTDDWLSIRVQEVPV